MLGSGIKSRITKLEHRVDTSGLAKFQEAIQSAEQVGCLLLYESLLRIIFFDSNGDHTDPVRRLKKHCEGEEVGVLSEETLNALNPFRKQALHITETIQDKAAAKQQVLGLDVPPIQSWTYCRSMDVMIPGARPEWYAALREQDLPLLHYLEDNNYAREGVEGER